MGWRGGSFGGRAWDRRNLTAVPDSPPAGAPMSKKHLNKLLAGSSKSEFARWYKIQVVRARLLRNGLSRRFGLHISAEVLHEEAIVNETICRMLAEDENYEWDGVTDFDEHFIFCLKRTLSSQWNEERPSKRHQELASQWQSGCHSAAADPHKLLEQAQVAKSIEAAIKASSRHGRIVDYIRNLPKYVASDSSSAEIAEDLGIKKNTLPQYRTRTRRLIDDLDA